MSTPGLRIHQESPTSRASDDSINSNVSHAERQAHCGFSSPSVLKVTSQSNTILRSAPDWGKFLCLNSSGNHVWHLPMCLIPLSPFAQECEMYQCILTWSIRTYHMLLFLLETTCFSPYSLPPTIQKIAWIQWHHPTYILTLEGEGKHTHTALYTPWGHKVNAIIRHHYTCKTNRELSQI